MNQRETMKYMDEILGDIASKATDIRKMIAEGYTPDDLLPEIDMLVFMMVNDQLYDRLTASLHKHATHEEDAVIVPFLPTHATARQNAHIQVCNDVVAAMDARTEEE